MPSLNTCTGDLAVFVVRYSRTVGVCSKVVRAHNYAFYYLGNLYFYVSLTSRAWLSGS